MTCNVYEFISLEQRLFIFSLHIVCKLTKTSFLWIIYVRTWQKLLKYIANNVSASFKKKFFWRSFRVTEMISLKLFALIILDFFLFSVVTFNPKNYWITEKTFQTFIGSQKYLKVLKIYYLQKLNKSPGKNCFRSFLTFDIVETLY